MRLLLAIGSGGGGGIRGARRGVRRSGRPRCSLTLMLSAALWWRWLRWPRCSLRPHGHLAAAQAGHAALRAATGGGGDTGHDGGGGFPARLSARLQSAGGGGGCCCCGCCCGCCCFPRRPRDVGLARPAEASRRAPLPVPADRSLCPRCCLRCVPGSRRCALCVRQSRAAARGCRRPTLRNGRKCRL
ncbi:transmembrane protein 121B-like [Pipra filicauda]|uniref:Transmembrane protein 121B-like n=1 Tax=Pipra filicauda TaxID=649802 RepID=A0A6J2HDX2_9PASS|nr:transmembrane protein 121B-like [Pipra filicauda]